MIFNDINKTWDNMPSDKDMSEIQLYERIKYIEQLRDELTAEQWEIDWKAEYEVACLELNRRYLSKV